MKKADRILYHKEIVKAIEAGDLNKILEIVDLGYEFNEDIDKLNPAVDDNSLILKAVEEEQADILDWLLVEAGLDPAGQDNEALKLAYEKYMNDKKDTNFKMVFDLIQHPWVRELLFLDCKKGLTLKEARFLLYVPYPVEEAKELLDEFTEDDDEASFVFSNEESEEDYYSDEGEYDDEYADSFILSDDTISKEEQEEVWLEFRKEAKEAREEEKRREAERAKNPFGF